MMNHCSIEGKDDMFEIGKKYDIKMLVGQMGGPEETTYPSRTVLNVDGPLIKIDDCGSERIINTQSLYFISAEKRGD
jgi:hypothetical protein